MAQDPLCAPSRLRCNAELPSLFTAEISQSVNATLISELYCRRMTRCMRVDYKLC